MLSNVAAVISPSAASLTLAQGTLTTNEAVWKSSAARRAEKAWAIQSEKALASDAKYKRYQSAIEKTLASFEAVSEWADFISFLTRLQKVHLPW